MPVTMINYIHHAEPAHGASLPVRYAANYDGDTVTVVLPSGRMCKIRLDGVRLPEMKNDDGSPNPAGIRAQKLVGKILGEAMRLTLFVALPRDKDKNGSLDLYEILAQATTFSRIVGRLYVDGTDLGAYLVEHGHGQFGAKEGVN